MPKERYTLEDFFFDLPQELIAQHPTEQRDSSRLFVLDRRSGSYEHSLFSTLHTFIRKGDLLVFNDTRVMRAKIRCKKTSGGIVDLLLTKRIDGKRWEAISNRMKRLKPGEKIFPVKESAIVMTIAERLSNHVVVESNAILTDAALDRIGEIALPPYIKRDATGKDEDRYQTVFARESGAVAAPTAGLHFTGELMETIREAGAGFAFVTLHVSWGTFQPVRDSQIEDHAMHSESYMLGEQASQAINSARKNGNRIIAVGTTALRVLETTFADGANLPGEGDTDIFIYPPMRIKSADALITNFHTPYSTLLMLVAAFAGYDIIMKAYREAVKNRYRFFSYGDAMLIQ